MNNHKSPRFRVLGGASFLAISLAIAVPAAAQTASPAANPWGATVTDVAADPAVRLGKLPNGMKYAIMRNSVPKDGAAVRMHFDFGSLGESDNERGLAHFIEHMAFNGSKNVPEGEMVKILERQGLKFGPDTNASTGFDATIYMLDLPKTDKERLDTAFMLMREVASNVSFDPAAVERERGVILGERRARDTFQLRQIQDMFGFFMPDAPYANRFPIGTAEVIQEAPAERLRSLYQRYYRPENATFVFVGDADPAVIEARIRQTFSDWRGSGQAGAELDVGKLDLDRAAAFDTFVDPAVANQIVIRTYRPWADPADTRADRRTELSQDLAKAMFNRRMQRIVNAPDSFLLFGGMSENDSVDLGRATEVIAVAKDGAWDKGLAIAEQELRRALTHGFTQSELDLQRSDFLGKLKTASAQAGSRTNAKLADQIIDTIDVDDVMTAPAWNLAFYEQESSKISLAEVNQALKTLWSGSPPLVHVASKDALETAKVASVFAGSSKVAVAAPAEEAAVEFAYDDWGKAGNVVADSRIADLGVRTVRFANNIRLNIKQTDFEPGKVNYSVRLGGGSVAFPKDKPGMGAMFALSSALAATGKHSLEDIKTIAAGRQVKPGIVVGSDAYFVQGASPADDIGLQMKLTAAYLTDPGFRPEADAQWQNVSSVIDKQFEAQPQALLDTRLPFLLTQGDGRFGFPAGEYLKARTLAEIAPLVRASAADAPIEITIVGDIGEQAAIDAVAQSFGALPERKLEHPIPAALRNVAFRAPGQEVRMVHTGDADQAIVGSVWRTEDDADFRQVMGLQLLSEVLDLVLTDSIREQLGASYGVSTQSVASSVYDDFGYLAVSTVVSPSKIGEVDKALAEAAQSLRDKPIDADLLARAKNPILEAIAKDRRKNDYWLGVLDEAQSRPERLDRVRQREALVRALTAADIQALAREYLAPNKMIPVRVVSDKAAAAPAASS